MKKYIGIDISKRDFHVSFSEDGEVLIFSNNTIGIKKFIKHLKSIRYTAKNTVIGLESTGSYHLPVTFLLSKAGYPVHIINPLIIKNRNRESLRRVKTDRKDAALIRHCLISGVGYPFRETAGTLALKSLIRQRARFSMLRHHARIRQEEITWRESYLGREISDAGRELHDFLDGRLKEMDRQLRQHAPKTQKLLQTIPGIGPQTAVTLISEIGGISRFPDARKLTAWIGLDPRVHQSGTSVSGKGYITKRGNKLLRTRLFNAASVAVIHPPNIFYDFFQKKRSEGKPYRVALCAVMRKMVHVIHAVWRNETPFVNKFK